MEGWGFLAAFSPMQNVMGWAQEGLVLWKNQTTLALGYFIIGRQMLCNWVCRGETSVMSTLEMNRIQIK